MDIDMAFETLKNSRLEKKKKKILGWGEDGGVHCPLASVSLRSKVTNCLRDELTLLPHPLLDSSLGVSGQSARKS